MNIKCLLLRGIDILRQTEEVNDVLNKKKERTSLPNRLMCCYTYNIITMHSE